MKLENHFTIPVPAADAWPVLLDLERIAPCVPGAVLTSREGDDFHGKIKVKLGPVGLTYTGIIKVLSQDQPNGVAVLEGGGKETRGNGTAKALVTLRMIESDGRTDVYVDTDLAITGKPAQFGRGVLADVAGTLIGRFADNLAAEITASTVEPVEPVVDDDPAATAPRAGTPGPSAPKPVVAVSNPESHSPSANRTAEPIDLLQAAGMTTTRNLRVAVTATLVVLVSLLILRRRRSRE